MPADYVGYEVEIYYTVSSLQHVARLKVAPTSTPSLGADFSTITVSNRDGSTSPLSTEITDFVNLMKVFYGASDDISEAQLWYHPSGTGAKTFVSSMALAVAGTGANGIPAAQTIFTFRTTAGHVAKFYLMENNVSANTLLRPPYPAGAFKNLSDWMINSATSFLGADEEFIYSALGIGNGQNEKLWRKRNRPT